MVTALQTVELGCSFSLCACLLYNFTTKDCPKKTETRRPTSEQWDDIGRRSVADDVVAGEQHRVVLIDEELT